MVHAVLADRAEQRLGEPAVPSAAHDQEIGAGFSSGAGAGFVPTSCPSGGPALPPSTMCLSTLNCRESRWSCYIEKQSGSDSGSRLQLRL